MGSRLKLQFSVYERHFLSPARGWIWMGAQESNKIWAEKASAQPVIQEKAEFLWNLHSFLLVSCLLRVSNRDSFCIGNWSAAVILEWPDWEKQPLDTPLPLTWLQPSLWCTILHFSWQLVWFPGVWLKFCFHSLLFLLLLWYKPVSHQASGRMGTLEVNAVTRAHIHEHQQPCLHGFSPSWS